METGGGMTTRRCSGVQGTRTLAASGFTGARDFAYPHISISLSVTGVIGISSYDIPGIITITTDIDMTRTATADIRTT